MEAWLEEEACCVPTGAASRRVWVGLMFGIRLSLLLAGVDTVGLLLSMEDIYHEECCSTTGNGDFEHHELN